jgi:protein-L-isoaspartate(D-aspartate) O-methyltransferase
MPDTAFQRLAMCLLVLSAAILAPTTGLAQGALSDEEARDRMVEREIVAAGVTNPRVIRAMRETPRHEFVPFTARRLAYLDMAVPIGSGQTISPPFVVALMTEALDPRPTDRVLEIGTGSGYQAAVLSPLVDEVYSIEIVSELGRRAARTLRRLRYDNVHTKIGDGFKGWPDKAPFDKIIITCSPEDVPRPLFEQMREGGRMVIPLGERYQQTLYILRKQNGRLVPEALRPTLFVPMTGQAERQRDRLPDPTRPEIVNGSFEKSIEIQQSDDATASEQGPRLPAGWHYQRQTELLETEDATDGQHLLRFHNTEPGLGCRALQAFPVDGRKVSALDISLDVRGDDLRPGQDVSQMAGLRITFFDQRRAPLGQQVIKSWRGTFPWQTEHVILPVPPTAREAILRIGLHGGRGTLDVDNMSLKPAQR